RRTQPRRATSERPRPPPPSSARSAARWAWRCSERSLPRASAPRSSASCPPAASTTSNSHALLCSPSAIKTLPAAVHEPLLHAFANSLHTVFLWGTFLAGLAFLLTLALKEVPL